MLLILAFNLFGDALRDYLYPEAPWEDLTRHARVLKIPALEGTPISLTLSLPLGYTRDKSR